MATTVLNLIMTFDGYIAGAHDEIDWIDKVTKRQSDSPPYDFNAFTAKVGAVITGNRSYDLGIEAGWFKNEAYGPSPVFVICKQAPEQPSSDADFRYVTTGIHDAHRLASEAAGDKWIYLFGGASIFQQFLNANLVDELHLTIAPIIIGKGIRLFEHLTERHIELEKIDGTVHSNGMIEAKYRIMK